MTPLDCILHQVLLAARANVNAQQSLGMTALMFACFTGEARIVMQLLLAGANPKAQDTRKLNASNYASLKKHSLLVAILDQHGQPPIRPPSLVAAAESAATAEFSAGHLVGRLGQFFDETFVIVPRAAEALERDDLTEFGRLVDKSQAGAERALENQIAETVHLQRYARELGATAASAFGAGFGGAVWAMVPTVEAERFASRWRDRYLRVHHSASQRALFFQTAPSPPAFELTAE